jgi:hypothetical protein
MDGGLQRLISSSKALQAELIEGDTLQVYMLYKVVGIKEMKAEVVKLTPNTYRPAKLAQHIQDQLLKTAKNSERWGGEMAFDVRFSDGKFVFALESDMLEGWFIEVVHHSEDQDESRARTERLRAILGWPEQSARLPKDDAVVSKTIEAELAALSPCNDYSNLKRALQQHGYRDKSVTIPRPKAPEKDAAKKPVDSRGEREVDARGVQRQLRMLEKKLGKLKEEQQILTRERQEKQALISAASGDYDTCRMFKKRSFTILFSSMRRVFVVGTLSSYLAKWCTAVAQVQVRILEHRVDVDKGGINAHAEYLLQHPVTICFRQGECVMYLHADGSEECVWVVGWAGSSGLYLHAPIAVTAAVCVDSNSSSNSSSSSNSNRVQMPSLFIMNRPNLLGSKRANAD